jgi:hypothetical protein
MAKAGQLEKLDRSAGVGNTVGKEFVSPFSSMPHFQLRRRTSWGPIIRHYLKVKDIDMPIAIEI